MRASRVAALLILCCAIGESSFLILARFHAITVFPIISSSKQIRLRRGPSRASFTTLVEISRPIGSIDRHVCNRKMPRRESSDRHALTFPTVSSYSKLIQSRVIAARHRFSRVSSMLAVTDGHSYRKPRLIALSRSIGVAIAL